MFRKSGDEPLHRLLYGLNILAVLFCFSGLFVPLMDPDAGVYASISRTMAERNDFVNLYFQENDWLDKPHFPFWVTALFFKIFGYHDWAYKLPGILFVLMGTRYTYLFALRYYNKTTALWSVFILLTSLHIIISNNDVRAEPFLTGLIIASVYHFARSGEEKWFLQLLAASFFAGCAVMTKGIFTLIPIGGAVAGQLILTRNWSQLFHWKWLLALLLTVIFTSPELYCLWQQFDLHPEKKVLGSTNVSGIRFFLWDSQFGRFFNTGPIKGKGDKLFFLHTLLWAFLPWALLMYGALFCKIRNAFRPAVQARQEWWMLSSALLTLVLFSFSGFQLPHYSNIIFPMLAVLTAAFITEQAGNGKRAWGKVQMVLSILLPVLVTGLLFFYRPAVHPLFIVLFTAVLVFLFFLHRFTTTDRSWLPYLRSGLAVLAVAVFLNLAFYPDLLRYQSGNQVAAYMNRQLPEEPLGRLGIYFPAGEFYLRQPAYGTTVEDLAAGRFSKARYLFITEEEKGQLDKAGINTETVMAFEEFHVTMLTLKFINPASRHRELKKNILVRLLP